MVFRSILYIETENYKQEELKLEEPEFFIDLYLDQIVNAINKDKEEYELKRFFYTSLSDPDLIRYRQEVMQDLENNILFERIEAFAEIMRTMRKNLAQLKKLDYKHQRESLFLDLVKIYCEAMNSLADDLSLINLKSQGLINFRNYLSNYTQSISFISLYNEANAIAANLSSVKYCILFKELRVQVLNYGSDIDYTTEIEKTFSKFRQGSELKNYKSEFHHRLDMNHVEAKILIGVAQLYPDIFLHLDAFYSENRNFEDQTILVFDREIQFYISYLTYISSIKLAGLSFCYPQVSKTDKQVHNYEGYDLALANKLLNQKSAIVVNDFFLDGKERIIVVSGPNQGGKTTFARTYGQLHYLASIGCPIPGKESKLFLFDKLFTHFEKEETIQNLQSKLEEDLTRIHKILTQATPDSIVILNEILTSTTLHDAIFLSKEIIRKIIQLNLLCVWVTFIDEIASFSEEIVSMVSTVVTENPEIRTFKIIRKNADGLAYAISIAEKYKLTYECLMERIKL